jgi:hypothetical protein
MDLQRRIENFRSRFCSSGSRVLLITGIALMCASFLIYPAYPFIMLVVPFPVLVKIGMTISAWVLSWLLFAAGFLLAGVEGYELLKERWKRTIRRKRRLHPDSPGRKTLQ